MKSNDYWYRDNWSGQKKPFSTLKEAIKSAKKEEGNSIAIYSKEGDMVKLVEASGFSYS